jgi:hypothetical protein
MQLNYLLKLADCFYKLAGISGNYWIRPDGTYFGGVGEEHKYLGQRELNNHLKINISDLDNFDPNDFALKGNNISLIYYKLYNMGYIRVAIDKQCNVLNFEITDNTPSPKTRIVDFILENHLENHEGVRIDKDERHSRLYSMEDFLEKINEI